jgi:hypothetical protein
VDKVRDEDAGGRGKKNALVPVEALVRVNAVWVVPCRTVLLDFGCQFPAVFGPAVVVYFCR